MRGLLIFGLVPGLASCLITDDACERRCRDFGAFWGKCAEIMIEEYHVSADCYEDPESVIDEDGFLTSDAQPFECETGWEANRSCLGTWRARKGLLSDEDHEIAIESCKEDTEYNQLMKDKDCHGMGALITQTQ